MDEFRFEHTCHLSEAEYAEIRAAFLGLRKSRRLFRRALLIALAVAFLFWEYTLLLGAAIIGVALVHAIIPRFLPATAARDYHDSEYLHGPVTYMADNWGLALKTPDFECRAAWRYLGVWLERDPWLVLSIQGMPMILLPIDAMKKKGNFDQIMALVRRNAVEFNSPEARGPSV